MSDIALIQILCDSIELLEIRLTRTADRTDPVLGDVLKCCAGWHTTIRVTLGGIVNMFACCACPHRLTPNRFRITGIRPVRTAPSGRVFPQDHDIVVLRTGPGPGRQC